MFNDIIGKIFTNNKGLKFKVIKEQNSLNYRGNYYLCTFEDNDFSVEVRYDNILKGRLVNRWYPYKIGDIVETKNCGKLKILEEVQTDNYGVWFKVQFIDTGYILISRKDNLKNCYDKLLPNVFNIGYLGESTMGGINRNYYKVWQHMLGRCYNLNDERYSIYGNLGVTVCKRWHCFKNFLEDIKDIEGWDEQKFINGELEIDKDKKQLNKKIGDRVYSKENCTWLSKEENMKLMYQLPSEIVAINPSGDFIILDNIQNIIENYNLNKQKIYACLRNEYLTHKGWKIFYKNNYSFELPEDVLFIFNKIENNNKQIFLVGGSIRTLLLNKIHNTSYKIKDYDFATNATIEEMKNIFKDHNIILTGEKHNTITIVINKNNYEITTFRNKNIDFNKNSLNIFEDAKDRDFTINCLYYNPNIGLIDIYGGVKDIENEIIKTYKDARATYKSDPLRMIRAIRFKSQLNFNIEQHTLNAIIRNNHLIKKIAIERIREELNHILISNNPAEGIRLLYSYNLLQYIIPELCICVGFDQNNIYHDKDIFEHIMTVVENIPNSLNLRLSALLHDIAKPQTFNGGHFYGHHIEGAELAEQIMRRMKYDNKTIEKVKTLTFYHMDRYEDLSFAGVKRFINRIGIENIDDLFELQIADIKGCKPPHRFDSVNNLRNKVQEVLNKQQPLSIKDLDVNGYDLIQLGMKPSKEMGNILNKLLELVLENPECNKKEILIENAIKLQNTNA